MSDDEGGCIVTLVFFGLLCIAVALGFFGVHPGIIALGIGVTFIGLAGVGYILAKP